jgi:hypothetical protein
MGVREFTAGLGIAAIALGVAERTNVGAFQQIIPGQGIERLVNLETIQKYLLAKNSRALRPEVVRLLKQSVQLPPYILDVVYVDETLPQDKDAPMKIKYKIERAGQGLAPANSIVQVIPNAFDNPDIVNFFDLISSLKHEKTHASIIANGGQPIVSYAIDQKGNLNMDTYRLLHELEAFKTEINDIMGVGSDGIFPKNPFISDNYRRRQLVHSYMEFNRLVSMPESRFRPGVKKELIAKYNLPQYKFLKAPSPGK